MIIVMILGFENSDTEGRGFLPDCVNKLITSLLDFKEDFETKAKLVDDRDHSPPTQPEPLSEFYPSLPTHSENEAFYADKKRDSSDTSNCLKHYPEAPNMTGGIGHLTCRHGVTKVG